MSAAGRVPAGARVVLATHNQGKVRELRSLLAEALGMDVETAVLDAGAEEILETGDTFEIHSAATDVVAVRTALQEADIDYDSAEAQFVPTMRTPVDLDGAKKVLRLIDALEDSDDVQEVYSNVDIPAEVAEQLENED